MFDHKIFDFINGKTCYGCYGVIRTRTYGISVLLKTPGGNWVVGNGVRVMSDHDTVLSLGYASGDWAHGHYFMSNEWGARSYFKSLSEREV